MIFKRFLPVFLLTGLLLTTIVGVSAQEATEPAFVNVRHLSPDAPAVDVFANDDLLLEAVEYPQLTGYLEVEPGEYDITIAPAGEGSENAVLGPLPLTFEAGHYYQVIAIGQLEDDSLQPLFIDQTAELQALDIPPGEYPYMLLHAVAGGPAVDLYLEGEVVAGDVDFGDYAFITTEPGFDRELAVTPAGTSGELLAQINDLALLPEYRVISVIGTADDLSISPPSADFIPFANKIEWLKFYTENPPAEGAAFETLLTALQTAGIGDALEGEETIVLVAPLDLAFSEISEADLNELLENETALQALLNYHVMERDLLPITPGETLFYPTLEGSELSFTLPQNGENVIINEQIPIIGTIQTLNGGINIISAVLVPPEQQ